MQLNRNKIGGKEAFWSVWVCVMWGQSCSQTQTTPVYIAQGTGANLAGLGTTLGRGGGGGGGGRGGNSYMSNYIKNHYYLQVFEIFEQEQKYWRYMYVTCTLIGASLEIAACEAT